MDNPTPVNYHCKRCGKLTENETLFNRVCCAECSAVKERK